MQNQSQDRETQAIPSKNLNIAQNKFSKKKSIKNEHKLHRRNLRRKLWTTYELYESSERSLG